MQPSLFTCCSIFTQIISNNAIEYEFLFFDNHFSNVELLFDFRGFVFNKRTMGILIHIFST